MYFTHTHTQTQTHTNTHTHKYTDTHTLAMYADEIFNSPFFVQLNITLKCAQKQMTERDGEEGRWREQVQRNTFEMSPSVTDQCVMILIKDTRSLC